MHGGRGGGRGGRGGRGGPHHGPPGFGPGPHHHGPPLGRGPPPGRGIFGFLWGPPPPRMHPPLRPYRRFGPPLPFLGPPGFLYHYPDLVPCRFVYDRRPPSSVQAQFIVYLPLNSNSTVPYPLASNNYRYYTIEIPPDIYPEEIFQVFVEDRDSVVLVTCPDVEGPNQTIFLAVEVPSPNSTHRTTSPTAIPVEGNRSVIAEVAPVAVVIQEETYQPEKKDVIGTASIIR